jgi:electron transfer flavoprotein alpha subunit
VRLLTVVEHEQGAPTDTSLQALTLARSLAQDQAWDLQAVIVSDGGDTDVPETLAAYGAGATHVLEHELLRDYAPEAWAESVAQLVDTLDAGAVVGPGTARGNEIMAHVAALTALPLATNCLSITAGDEWDLTRIRWGGSLLEEASLRAAVKLVTVAPHAVEATTSGDAATPEVHRFTPDLSPEQARTRVRERTSRGEGITLATAPVVVAGGRGVGSAEGFAILEELAGLLGGAVGCSRVATNAGWRPHSDQVGQTGTQVAPDLYIACGISGAIQHWVGCMNAKKILAINLDGEAPMVTRADYAVLGDLHAVLAAVVDEVRRRRDGSR